MSPLLAFTGGALAVVALAGAVLALRELRARRAFLRARAVLARHGMSARLYLPMPAQRTIVDTELRRALVLFARHGHLIVDAQGEVMPSIVGTPFVREAPPPRARPELRLVRAGGE